MDREEIKTWVRANAKELTVEELNHIAMGMYYITEWYYNDLHIGSFLMAVVKNDFTEACFRADEINRKALYLYALFLANIIPFDYRKKAQG